VDREAALHFSADLVAEQVGQGFTTVDVEIVHNQMDSSGGGILEGKFDSNFGELGCRRSGVAKVK
jgi:hypothetical protein